MWIDSDSESESDLEEMDKSKDSQCSRIIRNAVLRNPPSGKEFNENIKTFKILYYNTSHLWKEHFDAVLRFDNSTLDSCIEGASEISHYAISIRRDCNLEKTILTSLNPSVEINDVSATDCRHLLDLHDTVKAKMLKKPKLDVNSGDDVSKKFMTEETILDFKNDVEIMMKTGIISDKWLKNYRLYQFGVMGLAHELQRQKPSTCSCSDKEWVELYEKFNAKLKQKPLDKTTVQLISFSNKFALDNMVNIVSYVKHYSPSLEFDILLNFLKTYSQLSLSSSFRNCDKYFSSQLPSELKKLINSFEPKLNIYDNPGKMSKGRLGYLCSLFFPTGFHTSLFYLSNKADIFPSVLVKIYLNYKGSREDLPNTAEHLMHLLMTLGMDTDFSSNRNSIKGSVSKVRFSVNLIK